MRYVLQMVALPILSLTIVAQAQNVYVTQTAAGGNTGADCADARALSSLTPSDWVPGNTIHLCGTITATAGTSGLVAQGSGTSGSPITVKFETNAILESPYFGGTYGCFSVSTCLGGIEVYGYNYIIIDGGANGIIENTANGTDLANHQTSSGVTLSGNNYIIRNLTIKSIYANDPTAGTDWGGQYTTDLGVLAGSSNVLICNNTLDNARSGIAPDTAGGSAPSYPFPSCPSNTFTSGTNIFGNTLYDHCWQIVPGGSSTPIMNIFGNTMGGYSNWVYMPNVSGYYHTDGIIAFGDAGSQVLVYFFNNTMQVPPYGTAAFYCTYGTTGSGCAAYIFNNVFYDSATSTASTAVLLNGTAPYPLGPYYLYNNTFVNNAMMVEFGGDSQAVTIENNLATSGSQPNANFYAKAYGSNTLMSILTAADYNSFYGGRGYSFGGAGQYYCWPQSGGTPSRCGTAYDGPWVNTGFETHSVSANPQINSNYTLANGSSDIRAGTNLTSLCSTLRPLCYDAAGNARPPTGPWDIGAYEAPSPKAPVGLTGTAK